MDMTTTTTLIPASELQVDDVVTDHGFVVDAVKFNPDTSRYVTVTTGDRVLHLVPIAPVRVTRTA